MSTAFRALEGITLSELDSHSQQVSKRVVLLNNLEGPRVWDFGVWGVGKPVFLLGVGETNIKG